MEKKTPRRDATGHLDPKYAADLLARAREGKPRDDDRAFVGAHTSDSLAGDLGEQFINAATSGEETSEDRLDAVAAEEAGGPFIVTTNRQEMADGTDLSNPEDATREPFPTT